MSTKLSERVRAHEAAPWVIEEIKRLELDEADQAEAAVIWDQVEAILDGFTVDTPRPGAKRVQDLQRAALDLSVENERLAKLVPPEPERGPGFVGQGTWSVFAEKVVAERDEAREEIRILQRRTRISRPSWPPSGSTRTSTTAVLTSWGSTATDRSSSRRSTRTAGKCTCSVRR